MVDEEVEDTVIIKGVGEEDMVKAPIPIQSQPHTYLLLNGMQ
jgi:hypothetical protein